MCFCIKLFVNVNTCNGNAYFKKDEFYLFSVATLCRPYTFTCVQFFYKNRVFGIFATYYLYSLVASNGSLCKQGKKKLVLTQNVMIVFMLQIKEIIPSNA